MKKFLALLLALVMVFALAACGEPAAEETTPAGEETTPAGEEPSAAGSVYYLNFKPEQNDQWVELAELYTEETGVPVKVVTAASGTYETQLTAEMAKEEAPTLFQVNGPVGLNNWKTYCYDLSGSDFYGELTSEDYALKEGDEVLGVAYVIESYGIIVNKALLEQAGYTVDDIQSFEDLKAVAEDITARKDELG
ncbi:MAG TPA: ABC transporter substrate-binding protein, partial [Candidatus Scatomorpha pullistercoris]|nr:ABC transporter substrate-binding protein [Candidatus Scatomorpha pullistercoris]